MPHITHVDATANEFAMGGFDVGDNEAPFGRARHGVGESRAERDRGVGAGGRELDDTEPVEGGVVGVEPPTQAFVELLGPVDVGHRDYLDFEVKVELPDALVCARVVNFGGAHVCLLVLLGRPRLVFVFATSWSLISTASHRAG
jgi:hypothetical protein